MSKVLLIGYNPPPLEADTKIEAAHYRTWQFLEALVADGHRICFCANSAQVDSPRLVLPGQWKEVQYRSLPLQRLLGWEKDLQRVHDEFDPDCIVAVNFDCALSATKLRTKSPVWIIHLRCSRVLRRCCRFHRRCGRYSRSSVRRRPAGLRQRVHRAPAYHFHKCEPVIL